MWNDKCLRLQGLKDKLHIKGQHAPTFEKSVEIILEIIGATCSPRYLNWCRKEARKLRDRTPNMTPEQLKRISDLDERFLKKAILLDERTARRAERKAKKKEAAKAKEAPSTPTAPPPVDRLSDIWLARETK